MHLMHATQYIGPNESRSEVLTAVAAPLGLVFGQSLHHILDSPQLLLDLDVPLARRFCLRTHNTMNQQRCIMGRQLPDGGETKCNKGNTAL